MSGRLPETSHRELVSLLRRFSVQLNEKGIVLTGRNRNGEPFTVHQHPSQKCNPQKLSKVLKYAAISREEFWDWWERER